MVEYCPNCSRAELALKMIEDAATVARAVRMASPAGVALKLGDMALDTQRDRRGSFTTGPVAAADRIVKNKKRKVSKYQKNFGKNLKALKRKHPRTQAKTLMKRAHSMTKRQLR